MESGQELHITPIQRIIQWRESHVTDRQFIILLSFFVGFFAAVAAYVLHWLIRQIQYLLTAGFDITTTIGFTSFSRLSEFISRHSSSGILLKTISHTESHVCSMLFRPKGVN